MALIQFTPVTEPDQAVPLPVSALPPLRLQMVDTTTTLPWVQSKNLASKTLAMAARKIVDDWQCRYNYRPVLLETFVEKGRFKGTCYKAANWQLMGQTKGRGKLGPAGKISVPIKDAWLYPINSEYKNVLIATP